MSFDKFKIKCPWRTEWNNPLGYLQCEVFQWPSGKDRKCEETICGLWALQKYNQSLQLSGGRSRQAGQLEPKT